MGSSTIFYQMSESETSTYTYLLADSKTLEAVLIDPVVDTVERDLKLIQELGVKLKYTLETHIHADHITGASKIREATGARVCVSEAAQVENFDIKLRSGQVLKFGGHELKVIATPGHTDSCLSYYCEGRVFTGDALLIRGTGRTDFQQGSAAKLYRSLTQQLFTLPDETLVYPAHDYRGHTHSTIGMEKKFNPRVGGGKSESQFVAIMSNLHLDPPKKLAESVAANQFCGEQSSGRSDRVAKPA